MKKSVDQWLSQHEQVSEKLANAEKRQSYKCGFFCWKSLAEGSKNEKRQGLLQLTDDELNEGEKFLMFCIQQELDERSLRKLYCIVFYE